MQRIAIKVEPRDAKGKGASRRLRADGKIPAVLYGQGQEPTKLAVDEHDFIKATSKLTGEMVMFELSSDKLDRQLSIIRDAQRDPVTEALIHLDLLRIDINQPIDVEVQVFSSGTAKGVKEGGVLEMVTRRVHMRCLPDKVPSQIEVDVTDLEFNHTIHLSEIEFEEGIELLTDPDEALFSVVAPQEIEVEEPEEAAECLEGEEGEEAEGEEGEEGEGGEEAAEGEEG
ncbi:MAG: 50S ribosomal protein L25 [Candidatus Sumerlaeota bacterium]